MVKHYFNVSIFPIVFILMNCKVRVVSDFLFLICIYKADKLDNK